MGLDAVSFVELLSFEQEPLPRSPLGVLPPGGRILAQQDQQHEPDADQQTRILSGEILPPRAPPWPAAERRVQGEGDRKSVV